MEHLLLVIGAVLVNNVVLAQFLGLCPLMGVSSQLGNAMGMGIATTFVLTLAALFSWLLETWLLRPLNVEFLRILTYIMVIAVVVQFTEMVVRYGSPHLYRNLGIYLPLITTNCAVLGVPLLSHRQGHGLLEALLFGFGTAIGFTLVLVVFAGLRERLALADVPSAFTGAPVAFVTAGLLALVFMGFAGLV